MTDDQIECQVERLFDRLDRRYLNSAMTKEEYEAASLKICDWANAQHAKRPNLRTHYCD